MEIHSKREYPRNALSNLAPHPFVIDGVKCNSMEGFLQSLKFKGEEMQKHICTLTGLKAKRSGSKKAWKRTQTLWWKGVKYDRNSLHYQTLLDYAYFELAKNVKFRKALIASGNAVFTHSIGRIKPHETVLTRSEFTYRLTKLRAQIQNGQ